MSDKTEVLVQSLRVSLTNQSRILLLKEKNGPLYLPLFVGQFEAESIVLALQEIEISRPQPHDLFLSVTKALEGHILSVEITAINAATFFAVTLVEDADGQELYIDCRPSDAISIALRANVPIYVDKRLMQQYGVLPETDVRSKSARQDNEDENDSENDEGDLSAFSDFLSNF